MNIFYLLNIFGFKFFNIAYAVVILHFLVVNTGRLWNIYQHYGRSSS